MAAILSMILGSMIATANITVPIRTLNIEYSWELITYSYSLDYMVEEEGISEYEIAQAASKEVANIFIVTVLDKLKKEKKIAPHTYDFLTSNQKNFKKNGNFSLLETALCGMMLYDIPASLAIAQAAIESSWGQSKIATKYNNYYGIKWLTDKTPKKVRFRTPENYGKGKVYIHDYFAVYDNPWHSYVQYRKYLLSSKYYKDRKSNDLEGWINALFHSDHGIKYATGKNTDKKLLSIIRKYKLYHLDNWMDFYTKHMTDFNKNKKQKDEDLKNLFSSN